MSRLPVLKIGIGRDIAISGVLTGLILASWAAVFSLFGEVGAVNDSSVIFTGGILTVSGLLFRQYMLKEVLEYYSVWNNIRELMKSIEERILPSSPGHSFRSAEALINQQDLVRRYCSYLQAELAIIPLVPVVMIFLYGCAMLANKSLQIRIGCLSIMVFFVVYLSVAAVTSSTIACSASEPRQILKDLEEINTNLDRNS